MFSDLKTAWQLWGFWRLFKEGNVDSATIEQLATILIPLITPLITAGVKKLLIWAKAYLSEKIPTLPKVVMVILNPLLGAIIAAFSGLPPDFGAGLGLAGIGVREAVDQGRKALKAAPTEAK